MINLPNLSQKKALRVFKRFAKTVPFYRRYLKKVNVRPSDIVTIDDFRKKVPVIDKEILFTDNMPRIKEIFSRRSLNDLQSIIPSSGFSGKISFGISTKSDARTQEKHVDLILDFVFGVKRKKTLLLNALCMGINIPSTNTVTVNTGPREDMVVELVDIFSKEFDQTIIVGDNALVKNVIEKGIECDIGWHDCRVRFVVGGDGFPENFRTYLAHLMKIDIETSPNPVIASSFGLAELGLNIMWETKNTIGIRRSASLDAGFRRALLGQEEALCPMLFQYNPLRVYIEEVSGRLVFTNLNINSKTPVIRYASGDHGLILPYEMIVKTLKAAGLAKYTPRLHLPIAAVRDRLQYLDFESGRVSANMIKSAIYADFRLPGLTTGYFTIAESDGLLFLEIQLKEGVTVTDKIKERFRAAVASGVPNVRLELIFHPYREFKYGMSLDYERKFQHMRHCHPR